MSANSLLRRGLELFAAVRPIKIPDKGIDWTFFRENIEGEYIWGNKGIQVNDDLAVDFKVQTKQGSERIARAAFEFARKNGKKNVTIVTPSGVDELDMQQSHHAQRFMTTSLYALGVRPYTHASITSVADGFATVHGKAHRPLRK